MSQKTSPTLTFILLYGLLALPLSFAGLPIYVHAPDFYVTEFGLSLSIIGIALMILRVIDALQDPLIGTLSDRFKAHRPLIIGFGAFMLTIGFVMVFNPLIPSLWWFCLGIFVCTTGFSIVTINFHTLGGLWHVSSHDRTRITTLREAYGLLGLLIASILPSILMMSFSKEQAFAYLAYIYIPIITVSLAVFFNWYKRTDFFTSPEDVHAQNLSFAILFKNHWNKCFFGVYALSNFASSIPAVLVIFFIRDKLDAEALMGLFLMLYFLSGACFMPFWQFVSKKIGKIQAWKWSMIAACLTFIWAFFLSSGDIVSYGIICVLSGAALGADLALPPSILADKIEKNAQEDGASRYFAVLTFLTKSSFALATGITLPILGLSGYEPGVDLTTQASLTLSAVYALIPCILKIFAISVMWIIEEKEA